MTGLYTHLGRQDATLIKAVIKLGSQINKECMIIKGAKRALKLEYEILGERKTRRTNRNNKESKSDLLCSWVFQ